MTYIKKIISNSLFLILIYTSSSIILTSCGNDKSAEEDPEDETVSYIQYKGQWNGNLGFTNVPISTRLDTVGTNNFQGPLFYLF